MGFYGDERGCTVGYLLAIELLDMVHLVRLLMIFHGSAQKSATPNPLVNPSFYTMFLCKMQSLGGIPNVYAQANTYIYIYIVCYIFKITCISRKISLYYFSWSDPFFPAG